MKTFSRNSSILAVSTFVLVLAMQTIAAAPTAPNPVLAFIGSESVQEAGKQKTKYYFDVANKASYPVDMFAPAPELPPCGTNTKSSRTWVDIYDQRGKRLNGFCGLTKPENLEKIWFALEGEEVPPSWVYIELNDRKTGTKYKSNLAETTL